MQKKRNKTKKLNKSAMKIVLWIVLFRTHQNNNIAWREEKKRSTQTSLLFSKKKFASKYSRHVVLCNYTTYKQKIPTKRCEKRRKDTALVMLELQFRSFEQRSF